MPEWLTIERLLLYSLQFGVVVGVGLAAPRLTGRRDPDLLAPWLAWIAVVALAAPVSIIWLAEGPSFSPLAFTWTAAAAGEALPAPTRPATLWVLAVGAIMMLLYRAAGLMRLRAYRRGARPITPREVFGPGGERAEWTAGVKAKFFASEEIDGPLTFGSTVVLPARVLELPPRVRRAIAAHEVLHLRRRDWARLLARESLRSVLWFHPAAHLLLSRMARVAEQCVDLRAVRLTGDRRSYVEALIETARGPRRAGPQAALCFGRGDLKERVEIILKEEPMSRVQRLVWLASMSALLCGVAFWARDAFPLSAQAAPADAIHRVGGDVSAPRLIEKIEPNYTEEARDAKLEGTVVLSCEVHPDGRAHNVQVARGLGLGLDEQAVAAIESWSFAPGLKDGRPVIVAATVEVNFRLL